jgi:hypothetical protein
MIHQRTAVTTEDNHQPGVTGNLFETDMELVSKGTESGEGDLRRSVFRGVEV